MAAGPKGAAAACVPAAGSPIRVAGALRRRIDQVRVSAAEPALGCMRMFAGEQIMIDWQGIDSVFLDMDGTLLDLHFDNHFWLEHVPDRFAQARGLDPAAAREQLYARYRNVAWTTGAGSSAWTSRCSRRRSTI